jgi:hypothetical protein
MVSILMILKLSNKFLNHQLQFVKSTTLALGAGGTLTVLPADVNNSTDDIGITTLSVSPNTFNCTQNTTQNVTRVMMLMDKLVLVLLQYAIIRCWNCIS